MLSLDFQLFIYSFNSNRLFAERLILSKGTFLGRLGPKEKKFRGEGVEMMAESIITLQRVREW